MTKLIYFFLFNIMGLAMFAQNTNQTNKQFNSFSDKLGAADYSFNVGSQVGTLFNNSYYLSNYFSPNAKLDLTKKISVVVGVGVAYTQMNHMPVYNNEFSTDFINASQTSFYTYASGIYKLNPKINLNATILMEEAFINTPETPMALKKQYKDVSFGVNYNVNKHFSINAQMQFSDRPHNTYNNRYSRFGNIQPFGYPPFY